MDTKDTKKMPKNAEKFICEMCDFICSKQSNYDKHILTPKHKKRYKMIQKDTISCEKMPKNAETYICDCGKSYQYHSGLWRHKKYCKMCSITEKMSNHEIKPEDFTTDKDLIMLLIKENADLKNMMMEVIKNGTHNTTNNYNNKTFNLQVFLNETCKDAMNIMDFVDSIKLQLTDLESVGELGYVKGISNIIVKNLRALDITKRPVHCSDAKREVLYIKDNDKWEKEDSENNKLQKAIKYISHKNILLLSKWREKYPDSQLSDSPQSDKYHHMVMEAMGGDGNNNLEKMNKIIRNIAKEVVIEK